MAYTTVNKSTENFNTKLYTGTEPSNKAVTGVGFQPDWIWIKQRSGTENHNLTDSVRGVQKTIRSNLSDAEVNRGSNGIQSFDSDGFTAGGGDDINSNGGTFASWNWKAGTTGSGNTGGSGTYKAYSYSVNTTAGFSIVKYIGNGTSGHTIPHHLGSVPKMILLKNLDNTGGWAWRVYHASLGATKRIFLDVNSAPGTDSTAWNDTAPTSSVFTVGNSTGTNSNNENFIAYCFAEKAGYSKFGSYTGNGNANGTFIYTGFKPAFLIIKKTSAAGGWYMYDTKRPGYNTTQANSDSLLADTNDSEFNSNIDLVSNGFKIRTSGSGENLSGGSFIYMAFGQSLVGSNNVPCTAR